MLEYQKWLDPGGWRVLNVTADGVSELDMRSAQYRAILIRDGADALVGKMEHTVREQRKRCAEAP